MGDQHDPGKLPLPWGWPTHAKAAILNALSLASASFTIHLGRWMRRLGESGKEALVRLAEPVNRFPDFVLHLVGRLKALCPTFGKVKIAETFARAGLHIAPTTVGRMLKQRKPDLPGAVDEAEPAPELTVTAKRPNHVHHVDLTVVPTVLGGFWSAIFACQRAVAPRGSGLSLTI